jgi:murein DD-endopeptidase MepM/ murein hydrolase activator NlpD
MDPYLRRVYFSVAGVLIILWIGMFVRVIVTSMPQFLSFVSSPLPQSAQGTLPAVRAPGIRLTLYHPNAGDSFSSLALKFNLAETTLRSLNQANDKRDLNLESPLLLPSQNGIYHVVKAGQGLADIARAYGITLGAVLTANRIKGDKDLSPEDILFLPGAVYLTRQDIRWITLASLETQKGFLKPTTGRFADGFGERIHPITHKLTFHEGLDLAPGWRARVVATQDGRVSFAGIRAGYGRLVILDHGSGLTSWYAHLDEILVKVGQEVRRGELIGKVGKTGRVTGPHLHFEVRLNGKPRNPLLYLTQ